jgi:alpha-tubulin suppressor-like RCC1 family protein
VWVGGQVSRILAPYIKESKHGALFAWGTATSFQLGEREGGKTPTQVGQVPTSAALVATSNMHTVVVTGAGSVWTSGVGSGGRLGLGSNSSQAAFHEVHALRSLRVTWVAVSDNHSLAVIDSGAVFAWGCNRFGQLGLGPPGGKGAAAVGEFELAPRRLLLPTKTCIVSAGAGVHHSVLVS